VNQTTRLMLYHAHLHLVRHARPILVARVVLAVVAWVEVRGVAPVAVQVVLEAEVVQLAGVEVPEEVEVLLVRLVPPAGCPLGR